MAGLRALATVSLGLAFVLLPVLAAAQGSGRLEHFDNPASDIQREINNLYYLILPISIVVGVLVEAFLLYFVLRYRARPGRIEATEEHERGHTKLEVGWTIPPAVILLLVALLSTNTLTAIENPPTPSFTVSVIGSQWVWNFEYPDGSSSTNEIAVEAGKVVLLNVTATDVIHSWAIPALGVKIDAIPGRLNTYWFKANEPGVYLAQCMEYCAGAHANMRATVRVLPAGECPPLGFCRVGAALDNATLLANADRVVTVTLKESGGNPWSADPSTLTASAADTLGIKVASEAGNRAPHNLTVIDRDNRQVATWDPTLQGGRDTGERGIVHQFAPGSYTYYCAVPGHRELGMEGTLTVS